MYVQKLKKLVEEKKRNNQKLRIVGPCSAESPQQIYQTAMALKRNDLLDMYRVGVWKPRTRPNTFEGMGNDALPVLQELQEQHDISVTVEVGTPQHVESALKYGIRNFWIGARTSVSSFAVQQIIDAIGIEDVTVMIKNPISGCKSSFQGAVERFLINGIEDLGLILRGRYSLHENILRFGPQYSMVHTMRAAFPGIPIIIDPSHIAGKRQYIQQILSDFMQLDVDGLMIESHIAPEFAKTDKKQQLSIDETIKMFKGLEVAPPQQLSKLDRLRLDIQELDQEILSVLARRMEIVEAIGHQKQDMDLPSFEQGRYHAHRNHLMRYGKKMGIDPQFTRRMYDLFHHHSVSRQNEMILNDNVQAPRRKRS